MQFYSILPDFICASFNRIKYLHVNTEFLTFPFPISNVFCGRQYLCRTHAIMVIKFSLETFCNPEN